MLRFVRALDGEIGFDEKAMLPTRGAWVCAKKACLTKAFDKRLLFRGEKNISPSSEEMLRHINSRMKAGILNRLGLLRRVGNCDVGRDAVKGMILSKKAVAVLCASDFSERSLREIKENLSLHGEDLSFFLSPFSMEELGNCLGRTKTGVVALMKSRITEEILVQMNMLAQVSQ